MTFQIFHTETIQKIWKIQEKLQEVVFYFTYDHLTPFKKKDISKLRKYVIGNKKIYQINKKQNRKGKYLAAFLISR